jgi:tRNA dimethylallyltransferase
VEKTDVVNWGVNQKVLVVVVGPTAVGKTRMAIKLAKHFDTEIISADARQVFREMTIGTAKPTEEELTSVKHHLINSHSIQDSFDAAAFADVAMERILQLFLHKKWVVLCGGSGLYIKALLDGFDEMPDVKAGVREELSALFKTQGISALQHELSMADPVYFAEVDKQNPQRLIRALEVVRSSGKPYSAFRKKEQKVLPFQVIKIGLELPREELYARIDARMDDMIGSGLFEEAQSLYPFRQLNALQTVGYQEVFDFMEEKTSREEAIRLLKQNSRNYAKRQLTWFKKDKEIRWFLSTEFDLILQYIQEKS